MGICAVKAVSYTHLLKCKKQLTEAKESGKLIWLSQRNDSFEETT